MFIFYPFFAVEHLLRQIFILFVFTNVRCMRIVQAEKLFKFLFDIEFIKDPKLCITLFFKFFEGVDALCSDFRYCLGIISMYT